MERIKPEMEVFRAEVKSLLREVHPDAFRFDLLERRQDEKTIRKECTEMTKVLNALLEVSKTEIPRYLPEPFRSGPYINFYYGTFTSYTPVKELIAELRGHIKYRRETDARREAAQAEGKK